VPRPEPYPRVAHPDPLHPPSPSTNMECCNLSLNIFYTRLTPPPFAYLLTTLLVDSTSHHRCLCMTPYLRRKIFGSLSFFCFICPTPPRPSFLFPPFHFSLILWCGHPLSPFWWGFFAAVPSYTQEFSALLSSPFPPIRGRVLLLFMFACVFGMLVSYQATSPPPP